MLLLFLKRKNLKGCIAKHILILFSISLFIHKVNKTNFDLGNRETT